MNWKVKKYYTIGRQELTNICGYATIYGFHLSPYEDTTYDTFEKAEEDLIKLLENTKNRENFSALWVILPVYKTDYYGE